MPAASSNKQSKLILPERRLFLPARRVLAAPAILRARSALPIISPPMVPGGGLAVVPLTTNYTSPGTYSYTVVAFNTLTITLRGAGGGGGMDAAFNVTAATAGGATNASGTGITSMAANGGSPGGSSDGTGPGSAGAHGGASGGNSANTTGGGNAGGSGTTAGSGYYGGNGGYGGLCQSAWAAGSGPAIGVVITIVVRTGGAGASNGFATPGNPGANGSASVVVA